MKSGKGIWLRQGAPQLHCGIRHFRFFRDHFGPSCHAAKMVAGITLVLLDQDRMRLANDVALRGKQFGKGIPIVGIKDAAGQVLDFVVEPLGGCSITTAENPGTSSP